MKRFVKRWKVWAPAHGPNPYSGRLPSTRVLSFASEAAAKSRAVDLAKEHDRPFTVWHFSGEWTVDPDGTITRRP